MNYKAKPLSPHLGIYKPQVTSILSILHRITGVYMFFFIVIGALGIFFFKHPLDFLQYQKNDAGILTNALILMLFGFVFCLSYHVCAGIRYLFWTCNIGLNMKGVRLSAKLIIFCTLLFIALSMYLFFIKSMTM